LGCLGGVGGVGGVDGDLGGRVVVKVSVRVPHLLVVSSVSICNESCLRSVLNEYPFPGGGFVAVAVHVPYIGREVVHSVQIEIT